MRRKNITVDKKSYRECPACGIKIGREHRGDEEYEAHVAECHGYDDPEERFVVGDRVQFSDFGKIRLHNKRDDTLEREGEVVGFGTGAADHCVRVHWDGLSENTVYRYAHPFIKHAEDA